ncbi:MAG TPA: DMT family transporter [Alphaproteobacteria bacterium]|nr:DMT family transporter [Alphaproteobacteria bacterium]
MMRRLFDLPYLLLCLSSLFWAGNFIIARAVSGIVPPFGLVFWRWFGAFLILTPFAIKTVRQDWPILKAHWPIVLALSLVGVASFNALVYLGLQSTTALNALLLQSAMPLLIVGFGWALFRDAVKPLQGFGIALSLIGAAAIVGRGDLSALLGLGLNVGDALIFIAVALWAVYSVLLRKRPKMNALTFTYATVTVSVIVLAPLYLWESAGGHPMHVNWPTIGAVAYVAIFPSILAYTFWNRGVDLIGANRAGLFIHLMPLFGSFMAIAFLDEALELYHLIGAALILVGLVIASRKKT